MDSVKSESNYPAVTPRLSFLTQWLVRLRKRSSSSTPIPDSGFTPFWEKAETTGIMKIRELLCPKHFLQAWKSDDGKIYAYICVDCDAAFYVKREKFKEAWTREDPDLAEFRVHWWEEDKEAEVSHFFGFRNPGNTRVLGFDY